MDQNDLILLYSAAVIVGVGKACTLTIWRTMAKKRPPLRQEIGQAWQSMRGRRREARAATREARALVRIGRDNQGVLDLKGRQVQIGG